MYVGRLGLGPLVAAEALGGGTPGGMATAKDMDRRSIETALGLPDTQGAGATWAQHPVRLR